MVLMYGVLMLMGISTPSRMAWSLSRVSRKRTRSGPACSRTASSASSHSAVSPGSGSPSPTGPRSTSRSGSATRCSGAIAVLRREWCPGPPAAAARVCSATCIVCASPIWSASGANEPPRGRVLVETPRRDCAWSLARTGARLLASRGRPPVHVPLRNSPGSDYEVFLMLSLFASRLPGWVCAATVALLLSPGLAPAQTAPKDKADKPAPDKGDKPAADKGERREASGILPTDGSEKLIQQLSDKNFRDTSQKLLRGEVEPAKDNQDVIDLMAKMYTYRLTWPDTAKPDGVHKLLKELESDLDQAVKNRPKSQAFLSELAKKVGPYAR